MRTFFFFFFFFFFFSLGAAAAICNGLPFVSLVRANGQATLLY